VLRGGAWYILQRTKLGRAIRAVSQDREVASLSGINSAQIYWYHSNYCWNTGRYGCILVAPIQTVTPEMDGDDGESFHSYYFSWTGRTNMGSIK